jgi:hypothetical protein
LLRLIKQSKNLLKARPNVWWHLQEAYPKLIVFHPSHDGLLDRHGLRLVGEPELQPQTRPTGEGGRTFDPTSMQRQIYQRPVAEPCSVSIFHPSVYKDARPNSFGHDLTPLCGDSAP